MTKAEAYERWPEHDGHDIGASMGNTVCATCGYVTLEANTHAPSSDPTILYPYWR